MAVEKADVKGGSPEGRDTWLSTYPRSFPSRERRSLSEPVKTRTESVWGGSQPPARVRRKKLEERGSHLPFCHGLLRDGPVVPRDSVRAGVEALLFEVPGREGAGGGRDIEGWPKEKGGHGTRRSIDRSIASSPLELLHLKASASFPEDRACGPHVVHHHALGLQVAMSGHELFVRDRLGVARKGDGGESGGELAACSGASMISIRCGRTAAIGGPRERGGGG